MTCAVKICYSLHLKVKQNEPFQKEKATSLNIQNSFQSTKLYSSRFRRQTLQNIPQTHKLEYGYRRGAEYYQMEFREKNISISVSIFYISSFLLALVQKSWYSRWYSADMRQLWWLKYFLSGWQTAIASSTLHILHLSHYLPEDLSIMWQPNG